MENGSVAKCDCGRNIYEKHRYACDDCFERNSENDIPSTVSILQTIKLSESMKQLLNPNYGREDNK